VLLIATIVVVTHQGGHHPKVTARAGAGATSTTAPTTSPPPTGLHAVMAGWQLPAARSRAVAIVQSQAVLVLGGLDATSRSTRGVTQIDLASGAAQTLGALGAPAHDSAGAMLGPSILMFGGGEATTIATVQSYTAPGPGHIVGALPQARSDLVAVGVGDRAIVLGGFDGVRATRDILATTDGIHFQVIGQLPEGVRYAASALDGTTLYLFGGELNGQATRTIQAVDTTSGAARVAGHLPVGLTQAAAVVVNGSIFLLGGRIGGSVTNAISRFNPSDGSVTPAGTLPYRVAVASGVASGSTAYLIGGETPNARGTAANPTTSVVVLTPA